MSLKKDPFPFIPVYISFKTGLYTIPKTGSFLTNNPTHIHTNGNPWTKLVVPSTGSITQVGLSVKFTFFDSLEQTVSSPTKEKVG